MNGPVDSQQKPKTGLLILRGTRKVIVITKRQFVLDLFLGCVMSYFVLVLVGCLATDNVTSLNQKGQMPLGPDCD